MPFNIDKVPFYRAVHLFEEKKFQEAFELFYECAKHGNLYAPYYIQYLVNSTNSISLKLTPQKKIDIEKIIEHLAFIPQMGRPKKWLEASLLILALKQEKKAAKPKTHRLVSLREKLDLLGKDVANARIKSDLEKMITSHKQRGSQTAAVTSLREPSDTVSFHTNLYGLFYQKINHDIPELALELALVNKHEKLAYHLKTSGELEQMLAEHNYTLGEMNKNITDMKNQIGSNAFILHRECAWLMASAYMGNKIAQFTLSMQLDESCPAEKNLWILMAAFNNHSIAQLLAGRFYHVGEDPRISVNLEKARDMFEKGIAQKTEKDLEKLHADPYSVLGTMHAMGQAGLEKNDNKALIYFQKAADLGHPSACLNLGMFHAMGRAQLPKNYKLALAYYEKALKEKSIHHTTLYFMGLLYEEGDYGMVSNPEKAAQCFKSASEKNISAHYRYAWLLYSGVGVPKNEAEGLKLLITSAKNGHSCAAGSIWKLFSNGYIQDLQANNLTENDINSFFTSYKDRAINNLGTLTNYALALYYGNGLQKNLEEGLKILILAASKAGKTAAYHLAMLYTDNAIPNPAALGLTNQVIAGYLACAKTGILKHKEWISEMGWAYFKLRDFINAYELFQQGILSEQAASFRGLGLLYEIGLTNKGSMGTPDKKTAYEFYCKAAAKGCLTSMMKQGDFLLNGMGVVKDEQKAKILLEASLKAGHKFSAFYLSEIYEQGLGITQDDRKAFEYLTLAEETNHPEVLYILYHYYQQGIGTTANAELALKYLEKAANLGNIRASITFASSLLNNAYLSDCVSEKFLKQAQPYLMAPCEEEYPQAIFLNSLINVTLYPKQINETIKILDNSEKINPYIKSTILLQLLRQRQHIKHDEIVLLLVLELIAGFEQISNLQKFDEMVAKGKKHKTVTKTPNTALSANQTDTQAAHDKKRNADTRLSTKLQKIQSEMAEIINPLSKKIDLRQFNRIMKRTNSVDGIVANSTHSKGSNIQYTVESLSKTLCLSFHPAHRSNSRPNAIQDPNRKKSIRKFMETVQEAMLKETHISALNCHKKSK